MLSDNNIVFLWKKASIQYNQNAQL